MIKFFRTIRRKLLSENHFSKYLLYAIGEIVLVVIGILLALQINTWNEARKERKLESDILHNLQKDLIYNSSIIEAVRKSDSIIVAKNQGLLKILEDPESSYNDSLENYFGRISRYNVFYPRKMSYEVLKTRGLGIIKNDSLRSEIIKLYDETYHLNAHMLDLKRDLHLHSLSINNKRLKTLKSVALKSPNNFEALKSDSEFLNNLSYITAESINFLDHYKSILTTTNSVEKLISEELSKKQKAD